MARSESTDKRVQEALALGKQNQALLPQLHNWCRHLCIEDRSGGLVAQMSGLPMNLALSCPHAHGKFTAANLEFNARAFIVENCIGCVFHDEVFPRNFGRTVLNQHEQRQEQAAQAAQQYAARRAELQAEIDSLVLREQSQAHITALSILKLVQQLAVTDPRGGTAATIQEAASLSPQFFSPAALNYLALYLEDPVAPVLLGTIRRLLLAGFTLPTFAREQVVAAIRRGQYLDAAVGVFIAAVTPTDLLNYQPLLADLLERLDYGYRSMQDEASEPVYPHVVEWLQRLASVDGDACQAVLSQQVALTKKQDRIRVLGLLRDMLLVVPELVVPLTEAIVRSLEQPEDGYGESADHAARHTLALLYAHAPEPVMAVLEQVYPTLSGAAQVEVLTFYGRALTDSDLLRPDHATALAASLVRDLAVEGGQAEVEDELLGLVEKAAYRAPEHFTSHFTVLLGILLKVIDGYHTFQWYQSELQQPTADPTTFNPLLGKDFFEVHSLSLRQHRRVTDAERVVECVLGADGGGKYQAVVDVFAGLSSETHGFAKSRLVKVLRDSLTDPAYIGAVLPVLYANLFDGTARQVRWEAVRFVAHLLEKHPQCVTQGLLGAIKVLLDDPDTAIRGQAIRAYGPLVRQFAQQVEPAHLRLVLQALRDPNPDLHQAAVATSQVLMAFLEEAQQEQLLQGIQALEHAYYERQDFGYCQQVVHTMLRLTRDRRPLYLELAEAYLSKYCSCGDWDAEQDFLKRLTPLVASAPELRAAWLRQALRYLTQVAPSYSSFGDLREDLLEVLYQFPCPDVVAALPYLAAFARMQIMAGHFSDVWAIYAVLGAQGLHASVYELTQYLAQVVPETKATGYQRSVNESVAKFSLLEATVESGGLDATFLETFPC